ncbi:prepilin peptidase [Marivivens sp. LCG002]|uniref:prepilin peptidase n=1 Tax=Marivivens sp. LCG002 TaxID=3051171 RepID=UPI0025532EC7|nr:prepilin peptidase [Marivivens sp. LCG002]WIV50085.1 prepilin peptidase [Marivivens sp. LCG002]
MTHLTLTQSLVFLPFALVIGIYVAWRDLSSMKIPNVSVYALFTVFVVLGPFVMPLETYGIRWAQGLGMLVVGMILNAAGAMGAGDSKFIAAAAPFVAASDAVLVLFIFCGALLAAFAAHRLARMSPLRAMVPHWQSWETGRRFPMGFPLSAALAYYLALPLFEVL